MRIRNIRKKEIKVFNSRNLVTEIIDRLLKIRRILILRK